MWSILQERAIGLMLLVNADDQAPAVAVGEHLGAFVDVARRGGLVIGVTRSDVGGADVVEEIRTVVASLLPERSTPVFAVDARDAQQMRMMLMTLIADVEMRALLAEVGG